MHSIVQSWAPRSWQPLALNLNLPCWTLMHLCVSPPAVDMHTPNFVGQSLQVDNQRSSAIG